MRCAYSGHTMSTRKAVLKYHKKILYEDGGKLEIRMWEVPASAAKPEGVKYSLVYVIDGERVIGYDNAEGKGHHKHIAGVELSYEFTNEADLLADFWNDVQKIKKRRKRAR